MARYQASMRMGILNILVLVIAISLAVLGVLSLVTARAQVNLSAKQSESLQETYAEEVAGQSFLQLLDGRLAYSKQQGELSSGLIYVMNLATPVIVEDAIEDAKKVYPDIDITAGFEVLDQNGLYKAMAVPMGGSAQQETIDLQSDVAGMTSVETAIVQSAGTSTYVDSLAEVLKEMVFGIEVNFSTATGKDLSCVVGVRADGSYTILKWETARYWLEDSQGETLWMG